MQLASPPPAPSLEPELQGRLDALLAEGWEIWDRFDREVRDLNWHPFVAADYERVLATLTSLRSPGKRFLEWGSATGVIAIMADMLGFESWGIELDADLVQVARDLARRHGSSARFAAGSFLPTGYEWRPRDGDGRRGTIGYGPSAYPEVGLPLDEFDFVYAYPWTGEDALMRDLMAAYGRRGGTLLLHGGKDGVKIFRNGEPVT